MIRDLSHAQLLFLIRLVDLRGELRDFNVVRSLVHLICTIRIQMQKKKRQREMIRTYRIILFELYTFLASTSNLLIASHRRSSVAAFQETQTGSQDRTNTVIFRHTAQQSPVAFCFRFAKRREPPAATQSESTSSGRNGHQVRKTRRTRRGAGPRGKQSKDNRVQLAHEI